ncbi:TonB-dependent receptor [Siansivirga zeaxanthinifaciens]|uniref:TonB-dependent receptor n=1 Tax=Siansivirga zeaxanthinifaciens CC-SAMT-1 TaxID=1454006 RepID=A0A0C5WA49_9FLAO|nr:TonB-dependent receptor [Siansivirga zeaxanthinifaciens]AJR04013.1 TonB-dependent receptor [Siansivirga zeaxanthinifaciens CC-SAMT-1]
MKYNLVIIVCCFISTLYSQNCKSTFFGEVKDFHDGTPIVGAAVFFENLNKYTTTDINGKFTIVNICDGNLIMSISHLACDTKRLEVTVNGNTYREIYMEHHIEELHEVKIDGHTTFTTAKSSQESILKTNALERFSAYSLGDALKQISGVSSISTGNTIVKPVINGLHSSRIIVMTNGVRLQDQEWGVEHAPNIDLNTAGSINVIKGANALAYGGDAIGGVIVMKPLNMSFKDSLYGKTITSGQTNGRGYSFTSSLTKTWQEGWYVGTQASVKRFGDFEAANYSLTNTGMNSRGFSVNTGFKTFEKGFNLYYSFLNNEIAILRAAHIGNISDLVNSINSLKPLVIRDFSYNIDAPRQDVTHQIIKADFYKRFKKFGRLEIQYDFQNNQRFEYDIRVGADRDKPAIDLTLKTHTLRTNLKIDAISNAIYEFGFNAGYQNNFANPDTGVRRLIPDYNKYDFGVFAISNYKLSDKTQLDLGVRYDFTRLDAKKFYITSRWNNLGYNIDFADIVIDDLGTQLLTNPVFNYHNISASAGISYQINDDNSLIFNYGLSKRAPNPSELFSDGLHHSAARIELGDLRIKQETSNRIAASYQFKNNPFNLNLEGFVNHISDYIFIKPSGTEQTIRGAFPVWDYTQTNALLLGLDVTVRYAMNDNWFLSNKTAFIKGRDLTQKQALIDIPSFKTVNILGYSNKKWKSFNAELQSELVLRQNDFTNFNFETFIPTSQETVLVDVSSPPPTYHLLHFQSDITLKLSTKTNLNIGFNITNIFNTSYREYLNRLRYFADDLGRNFMLQLKINY